MTHKYEELPRFLITRDLSKVEPGDTLEVNQYSSDFMVGKTESEIIIDSILNHAKKMNCKLNATEWLDTISFKFISND